VWDDGASRDIDHRDVTDGQRVPRRLLTHDEQRQESGEHVDSMMD
jgi:hypothetical protein